MNILGIETSCDETGVAVYDPARGLLAERLYTQVRLHADYGGVVPELASRDHIRRVLPLAREACAEAGLGLTDLDAVAYTEGPGLAGALLVGASIGRALAYALGVPGIGIHHLEGHLLSPLLAAPRPQFPFIALLVSGGHTQLMRVGAVGDYALLGDTLDDAAGEAFDKTAQLLGLGYPGGPALAALAEQGTPGRLSLPRPMLAQLEKTGDLDFSFSGLKTAVLTLSRQAPLDAQGRSDLAAEFEAAVVEVLTAKCLAALGQTGLSQLVVAGGVGANRRLRATLTAAVTKRGGQVFFPPPALCTDNGAMIALAGALRLGAELPGTASALRLQQRDSGFGIRDSAALTFGVRPRWDLATLRPLV